MNILRADIEMELDAEDSSAEHAEVIPSLLSEDMDDEDNISLPTELQSAEDLQELTRF